MSIANKDIGVIMSKDDCRVLVDLIDREIGKTHPVGTRTFYNVLGDASHVYCLLKQALVDR